MYICMYICSSGCGNLLGFSCWTWTKADNERACIDRGCNIKNLGLI